MNSCNENAYVIYSFGPILIFHHKTSIQITEYSTVKTDIFSLVDNAARKNHSQTDEQ
jgi:hypothetical protein